MPRVKDGDAIAVRHRPPPVVARRVSNIGIPGRLTIVYMNAVNDNVTDIMNSDTSPTGNVYTRTPSVDGLEGVHDQFLLESDDHVSLEDDP